MIGHQVPCIELQVIFIDEGLIVKRTFRKIQFIAMFSDKISQRIFATLLGSSAFLLSLSLVVFLTQQIAPAQAEEFNLEGNAEWDQSLRGGVGLGIVDNTGYFVIWGDPNKFYKVELDKATDWFSE